MLHPDSSSAENHGEFFLNLAQNIDDHLQGKQTNWSDLMPTKDSGVGAAVDVALTALMPGFGEAEAAGAEVSNIREAVDDRLFGCVFTLLAEEVLALVAMDENLNPALRQASVEHLVDAWENFHQWAPREYLPPLQATWDARRRIRVGGGTLLGVGEILRLLQSGCDPEFVDFFSRETLTEDEQAAFHEFLIGVTTEQIHSLEEVMKEEGRTSFSREEAQVALELDPQARGAGHPGVRAFQFFRERSLAAAARRMRDLDGPKKTAEEYVMIYFLEQEMG